MTSQAVTFNDKVAGDVYQYTYDDSPSPRMLELQRGDLIQSISYDPLGRVSCHKSDRVAVRTKYLSVGEHATDMISAIEYSQDNMTCGNLRYTYDKCGNIQRVYTDGRESVKYTYDGLNRLTREDNRLLNQTYTYQYDQGGNIVQKSVYKYTNIENIDITEPIATIPYTYCSEGWTDQLLGYDGKQIAYDIMGNPTTYLGKTLVWDCGRQLLKYGELSKCTYLPDGTRISKKTGGMTTTYHTIGGS